MLTGKMIRDMLADGWTLVEYLGVKRVFLRQPVKVAARLIELPFTMVPAGWAIDRQFTDCHVERFADFRKSGRYFLPIR